MKKIILTALAGIVFSGVVHAAAKFEGTYDCKGKEIGTNEPFTCQVTFQKTQATYSIKSTCDDGSTYTGTGIYDAKNNLLAAAFMNPNKAEETGVGIHHITNKGLSIEWTYLNKTDVATAICEKHTA